MFARCFNISAKADVAGIKFIPKDYLINLLRWEKLNRKYEQFATEQIDTFNEDELKVFEDFKKDMEIIELELQRSDYIINPDGGISVRILPNQLI